MRLFLGIPLPPGLLAELAKAVVRLRSSNDDLRWTAPESWHITLQFLGNTAPDQYQCLVPHLSQLQSPPVPIQLAGLGFFHRTGIFFVDVVPTPELVSLATSVAAATSLCRFVSDARPCHPHITLARAKRDAHGKPFRALQQMIHHQPVFPRFLASEFLLYESLLSSAGSTYEVRHRFHL